MPLQHFPKPLCGALRFYQVRHHLALAQTSPESLRAQQECVPGLYFHAPTLRVQKYSPAEIIRADVIAAAGEYSVMYVLRGSQRIAPHRPECAVDVTALLRNSAIGLLRVTPPGHELQNHRREIILVGVSSRKHSPEDILRRAACGQREGLP